MVIANNIHIAEAYTYKKSEMYDVLEYLRTKYPNSQVWNRTFFSLKAEWICHNFLYKVGYKRDHTADADLDYPCDKPEWVYCVLSIPAMIFIK